MANSRRYQRFKYTENELQEAINCVREQKLNLSAAAKKYGIPKATLSKKLRNVVPLERRMGPPPILTTEEEDTISKWIIAKAKLGFPMHPDPDQIWYTKQAILKEINIPLPCDNMGNFIVPELQN